MEFPMWKYISWKSWKPTNATYCKFLLPIIVTHHKYKSTVSQNSNLLFHCIHQTHYLHFVLPGWRIAITFGNRCKSMRWVGMMFPRFMIFFSCPEQLNRWPCHGLTDSLSDFWFWHYTVTLETCDLWNIWSEWWEDIRVFYNGAIIGLVTFATLITILTIENLD